MLSKTEIFFEPIENLKINVNNGSIFHGFLMEKFAPGFVEELHLNQLKPITQNLRLSKNDGCWIWTINTLSERAYEEVHRSLTNLKEVQRTQKNDIVKVRDVKHHQGETYQELTRRIYSEKPKGNIILNFYTPTSFKISGNNVVLPDISMLYQNLFNRWDFFAEGISLKDHDALAFITGKTYVSQYKLRTTSYNLESAVLRGFVGDLHLKIKGPDPLVSLSNLLFAFASYSGLGSRTALGMGGVNVGFH